MYHSATVRHSTSALPTTSSPKNISITTIGKVLYIATALQSIRSVAVSASSGSRHCYIPEKKEFFKRLCRDQGLRRSLFGYISLCLFSLLLLFLSPTPAFGFIQNRNDRAKMAKLIHDPFSAPELRQKHLSSISS